MRDLNNVLIVKVGQLGGREGRQEQGEKREIAIGRRGKPWVPWEQLWQVVTIINHKMTTNKLTETIKNRSIIQ